MTEFIRQSREGAVVVITMTNPGKYNAFNLQMRDEMIAVYEKALADGKSESSNASPIWGSMRGFALCHSLLAVTASLNDSVALFHAHCFPCQ